MRVQRKPKQKPLQHVAQFYGLVVRPFANLESGGPKFGRAKGNGGIAGKAEAFFGQENADIHFAIGVFIMDHRDRIGTGCKAIEANRSAGRREFCGPRLGVLAAIREGFGIGGQANQHIAFGRSLAIDGHIKRAACRRLWCVHGQSGQGQGQCRKADPRNGNRAHNSPDTRHDDVGDALLLSAYFLTDP